MSIENILDLKRSSIVKDNREYLKMLLEFHRYFCLQELPYRGHDETQESMNPGNWKELLKCSYLRIPLLQLYPKN